MTEPDANEAVVSKDTCLPEDRGAETVLEDMGEEQMKDGELNKEPEEKEDGEEEKGGGEDDVRSEEKKDVDEENEEEGAEQEICEEKKDDGENDLKTEENEEGKIEDVDMVEAADAKDEDEAAKEGCEGEEEDRLGTEEDGVEEDKLGTEKNGEEEDKLGTEEDGEEDDKQGTEKDGEEGDKLGTEKDGEEDDKLGTEKDGEEEDKLGIEKDGEEDDKLGTESDGEEEDKLGTENDVKEKTESGEDEKKADESKEVEVSRKKRSHGQKISKEGSKKEKKESPAKAKESPRTPAHSFVERPVRERKTVERLVEVIEKESYKELLIEKGRGTPLKDIPNVAYKLARKKSADLKLLHQTLFGRRGKAVDFKNHILQFSGFAWNENEETQRAKTKEKLDKYVKDTLLDICDIFDIHVSRATTKKEDLLVKLLDFMVAPHATTDVILGEKDQQSSKSRKRKSASKGTASKNMGDMFVEGSRKKRAKSEHTSNTESKMAEETEDDDETDHENGLPDEDEPYNHSDSDRKETEPEEADEDDDEHLKKGKGDMKRSSKQRGSSRKKQKLGTSPKKSPVTIQKSISKTPSSKHQSEERNDSGEKVFSRRKKHVDALEKKSTPKPDKKEKVTGKRTSTGKAKTAVAKESGPSKEELMKTICKILKEVDFNTATFTDILKRLDTHYKMDLKPRKSAIKLMIQEELTKLADEAEDDEDEEDTEKDNKTKSLHKELEA